MGVSKSGGRDPRRRARALQEVAALESGGGGRPRAVRDKGVPKEDALLLGDVKGGGDPWMML